jgi:hypothetical protein
MRKPFSRGKADSSFQKEDILRREKRTGEEENLYSFSVKKCPQVVTRRFPD